MLIQYLTTVARLVIWLPYIYTHCNWIIKKDFIARVFISNSSTINICLLLMKQNYTKWYSWLFCVIWNRIINCYHIFNVVNVPFLLVKLLRKTRFFTEQNQLWSLTVRIKNCLNFAKDIKKSTLSCSHQPANNERLTLTVTIKTSSDGCSYLVIRVHELYLYIIVL